MIGHEAFNGWGKAIEISIPKGLVKSWSLGGYVHGGYILVVTGMYSELACNSWHLSRKDRVASPIILSQLSCLAICSSIVYGSHYLYLGYSCCSKCRTNKTGCASPSAA